MFRLKTAAFFAITLSVFACKQGEFNNESSEPFGLFGSSNEQILPIKTAGESYIGIRRSDTALRPSCAVVSNGSKWEFFYNLDSVEIDGKKFPQYPEGELAEVRAYERAIAERRELTKGVDDALLSLKEERSIFVKLALKMKLGTNLPAEHRYKIRKGEQKMGSIHYWFEATSNPEYSKNTCYFSVLATEN